MDPEIYITFGQEQWLKSRGGRTRADVLRDEKKKLYVLMGDGDGGWTEVYLPNDKDNGKI